ncbi:MAG: DUF1311 domain-containing protein [Proteobacteria bacterium]|nr:DUF1311 domain-containing protein [Pseudomonadota bacterium]
MKPLFSLLVLSILFVVHPAWADVTYDKCIESSDGTNSSWSVCGGQWIERADRKLNEVWQTLYKNADGQTKSDLLAEQRAWNAYKEKSCNFLRNGEWGREGQVLHHPICRAKVIEYRIKELQSYETQMKGK